MGILLYFVGMVAFVVGFLVLNKKTEWITKDTYRFEAGPTIFSQLLCILFWPVGFLIVLGVLTAKLIHKHLPD